MSLATLMVHDVTVVHAGMVVDPYGETKDWAAATRTAVRGWVSRRSQLEDRTGGREAQVSEWVAYLPAGTAITGGDRVEWSGLPAGTSFEVDGPPLPAATPRGPHHIEAQLRVVEG
jgi:hypothetical protein